MPAVLVLTSSDLQTPSGWTLWGDPSGPARLLSYTINHVPKGSLTRSQQEVKSIHCLQRPSFLCLTWICLPYWTTEVFFMIKAQISISNPPDFCHTSRGHGRRVLLEVSLSLFFLMKTFIGNLWFLTLEHLKLWFAKGTVSGKPPSRTTQLLLIRD